MMRILTPRLLAGSLAGPLLLGAAFGGVDVEAGRNASVQGTILPAGESEVLRFVAPAGASLSFTLSATKTGANALTASLAGPAGAGVDLHAAKKLAEAPRKIVCQKLTLTETGAYALRVSAAGAGAYKLVLTATPAPSAHASSDVGAGQSAVLRFGALAGTRLTLTAKAARRSAAVPRFGRFDGTDLASQGRATPKSHVVTGLVAADTADHALEVRNVGAAGGAIDVTVATRPPAAKLRKVDVRGVNGGGTNVERTIVAASGGEIDMGDAPGPLGGCVLTVPAGALAQDTRIVVASAPTPAVADPATQQPAGPAAELRPSGTTFTTPVTVRLPFDPSAFPRGADPATTLLVVRREADGTATTIVPSAVLTAQGLYEFRTLGFSTFVPVAPKGPPSVGLRSYWSWRFTSAYENSPADSRGREFRLRSAIADVGAAGTVALTGEERVVVIDHTGQQAGQIVGSVVTRTDAVSTIVPWQYTGLADPAVTVDGNDLAVGEDGVVLAGAVSGGWDVARDVHLFVQRPAFPPTAADVAGPWWLGRIAIEPVAIAGSPAKVTFRRTLATLDLRTNGVARIVGNDGVAWYEPATSKDRSSTVPRNMTGTWTVAGPPAGEYEGAVDVVAGASSWRLLPGRGGQILAGTDAKFEDGVVSFVVAVRKSTDRTVDDIDATYSQYGIDIDPTGNAYTVDGVGIEDWTTTTRRETRWHEASQYFHYTPHESRGVARSAAGAVVPSGFLSIRVDMGKCAVSKDGVFEILGYEVTPWNDQGVGGGVAGGIAPDLSFGFGVPDPLGDYGWFGLRYYVRIAPHQTPPDFP